MLNYYATPKVSPQPCTHPRCQKQQRHWTLKSRCKTIIWLEDAQFTASRMVLCLVCLVVWGFCVSTLDATAVPTLDAPVDHGWSTIVTYDIISDQATTMHQLTVTSPCARAHAQKLHQATCKCKAAHYKPIGTNMQWSTTVTTEAHTHKGILQTNHPRRLHATVTTSGLLLALA